MAPSKVVSSEGDRIAGEEPVVCSGETQVVSGGTVAAQEALRRRCCRWWSTRPMA